MFCSDRELEHPVITNLRETGHPYRRAAKEIRCPICGAEAENFYMDRRRDVVGCDRCLTIHPYYEFEEE